MKALNNRGFGLIEVMICIGIMSIITLGMATQMHNQMIASTTADVKNSVAALVGSTSQTAIDPIACTLAITKTPQIYGSSVRFDLPDARVLAAGQIVADYGIYVKDFQYKGATLVATGYEGTKVYYGSLLMSLGTNKQVFGPREFAPRAVASVYFTVSPAGKVVACGAKLPELPVDPSLASGKKDDEIKDLCKELGGTYSNGGCNFRPAASDKDKGDHNDDGHEDNGKDS